MSKPVYLYGAGGHAKVILDILEAQGRKVRGVFDDHPAADRFLGYPILTWEGVLRAGSELLVSVGDNDSRRQVAERCGGPFAIAIHPNVFVSRRATVGEGTAIMSGVTVHSAAVIGAHAILNTHAVVDHDCQVGSFVHIGPGAVLCGNVRVGEGTLVGAGAVLIPGVSVGRGALIAAGAVVNRDVPDFVMVGGNPARVIHKNS